MRNKEWPIYLTMLLIATVLVYQGRHYIMQIYYNGFLIGLCAMAFILVLVAWHVGADEG